MFFGTLAGIVAVGLFVGGFVARNVASRASPSPPSPLLVLVVFVLIGGVSNWYGDILSRDGFDEGYRVGLEEGQHRSIPGSQLSRGKIYRILSCEGGIALIMDAEDKPGMYELDCSTSLSFAENFVPGAYYRFTSAGIFRLVNQEVMGSSGG